MFKFSDFNNSTVNEYYRGRKYDTTMIDRLFPMEKTPEMKVRNVNGAYGLPVAASIHAFDSTTQVASREPIRISEVDKQLVKKQIPTREELIMELNDTNNPITQSNVVKQLYNDVDLMVEAVLTRTRAMAMEALTTGHVTTKNDINLNSIDIDYGLPAEHFEVLAGNNLWSADTCDPIEDLTRWAGKLTDDGAEAPAYILASRKVLSNLFRNANFKKAIMGTVLTRPLTRAEVNTFLEAQSLPKFVQFDQKYRVEDKAGKKTTIPYLPENKVVLLPNAAVGKSVFGPTPEEYELVNSPNLKILAQQNVIIEVYKTPDPVAHWTKAVCTNIPSFDRADEVFIATVTN